MNYYIEDIWLVRDQLIKYLQGRFKGAFSKIGLNLTDKGKETITRFKDTTFTITITISNGRGNCQQVEVIFWAVYLGFHFLLTVEEN